MSYMNEPLPITLCVSTRNEEASIRSCLDSCAGLVSEIIIVDMESTDRTLEIARELGAQVIRVPAAGFAEPGRQQGIDAATQPWVLVLDADERPGPRMLELVRSQVHANEVAGVRFPRENRVFGRWIRHSGFWPDYQIRLFRRDAASWPPYLHTQVQVDGPLASAPASPEYALVHQSIATVSEYVAVTNTYTDFEVDRYVAMGRSASFRRLLVTPLARFAQRFLFHRGFLDGRFGVVVALFSAFYAAVLELKIWERQRAKSSL